MTCSSLEYRRRFGIIYRFHLQGRRVNQTKIRVRRQVACTALRLAGCLLRFAFKSRIKEAHAYDRRSKLSCCHVCLLTAVEPTQFQQRFLVCYMLRDVPPDGHWLQGAQEGVRQSQYRNSSWDPEKGMVNGVCDSVYPGSDANVPTLREVSFQPCDCSLSQRAGHGVKEFWRGIAVSVFLLYSRGAVFDSRSRGQLSRLGVLSPFFFFSPYRQTFASSSSFSSSSSWT
jgi:hypothetical protein